ncbi:MAG TPA: hypothetical protein VMB26_09005 [Candidatus Binataceae bacterium]|nr:hypothetical protein [Candidatus Binataceae bacterium]
MSSRTLVFGTWMMLAVVVCSGCGIKTKPRAPEDVRPEQIVDLRATSVADGIQLAWTRPDRYQNHDQMRDLSDFLVLRGTGNQPMVAVGKLPVTDQQRFQQQHHMLLVDRDAKLNQHYRYQIISETSDGYQSLPSNEAALVRVATSQPAAGQTSQHPAPGIPPMSVATPVPHAP